MHLLPAGQLHWSDSVLEEPQAPGYGTQNCGITTNSVNDYLVCRYSPSGNFLGQVPYGQQPAAAVGEEETTLSMPPPETGEETAQAPPVVGTGSIGDQAVTGDETAEAPPP